MHLVHGKQAETLGHTGTEHHAYPQQTGQHIRHLASLDKAEYHAPHTTERQAVQKHGRHIERRSQQAEAYQSSLGCYRRTDEKLETTLLLQLRNQLDAKELGYHIT